MNEAKFGQGLSALVVDDESHILLYFCEVLGDLGFEVEVAESVAAATQRFDAKPYDLLITDKNLPDGTGLDVARYVRGKDHICEIVVITAYATVESLVDAMQVGVSDFLTKPFTSLEELTERLRKVVTVLRLKREQSLLKQQLAEKDARIAELEATLASK